MNPAIKLLRVIGSPFIKGQELPRDIKEALALYEYAVKNKIGLFYLEALKTQGCLGDFGLQQENERELGKLDKQLQTATVAAKILNSASIDYAIFKSIMPFPAVSNDIDILLFGSENGFRRAVEAMLHSGYIEIKGKADASQCMFHDTRECLHTGPGKDVYDVDLYQKAAASYLIYLDKAKLAKHVIEINMAGDPLRILKPEAELVATITHSIIPEQLFTLFVYYATLHHLARMSVDKVAEFVSLVRENHVIFPVKAHFSLIAELHQVAYGFIPEKVQSILNSVRMGVSEVRHLRDSNFRIPHRYSWSTIIKTLLDKARENEFRKSLFVQAFHMLNPSLVKCVISEVIGRRRRESY